MSRDNAELHEANARIVELGPADGAHFRRPVAEPAMDTSSLATRLWTIVDGRWTIAAFTLGSMLLAIIYILIATPIYRSTATLQVEDRRRTIAGLDELSAAFGEKAPSETEIEILTSRMLLGSAAADLGLDVRVEPRYFPLIGRALARRHPPGSVAPARLGLESFAWGGDQIKVRRIDVSEDLLAQPLTLTALGDGRFSVTDPDRTIQVEGVVGKAASGQRGSTRIDIFVSDLSTRPGVRFDVTKYSLDESVDRLLKMLKVSEKGKRTGIIVVDLEGSDPRRVANIVNTVSNYYVRQNVERKSEEAAKTLEFLESQLPILKSNLDAAQTALKNFQVNKGSVDLTSETSSMLERSVEVDRALQDLEMQRAELRHRFTENHPALASINEKAQQLRAERAAITARMREVPAAEADSARLVRDVKSASELYTVLLNKAQELRVVKSGTVGNVRIIDQATVARKPEHPRKPLILIVATVLGLLGGVGLVFIRRALDQTTDDPDEIEAATGLPVYATVPHTGAADSASRRRGNTVLAHADPSDTAIENIRSLRTSLQFALVESRNNVICISGPGMGVGKSFVAANLAYILAATERRVLLIDCDLRRGALHRQFGLPRQPGVSDVVSGSLDAAAAVQKTSNPALDILSTGRIPPNPAELISSNAFRQLLEWASRTYGLVVVDTPPVLAVTDPSIVARLSGVNLLVLRAGAHSLREITLASRRLAQGGAKVHGAVLNDLRSSLGRYGKYGRYQKYSYESRGD